jgi:predicted O-methyltransferase YrrM
MKYNIQKSDLEQLNFDEKYKNIVVNEPEINFFSKPGKEHYKLLSYFSTLFDNSNIIDIGSHLGHSALALSYNKNNTIYSFDIVDNVRPNIKGVENIKFINDDLFDKNISL